VQSVWEKKGKDFRIAKRVNHAQTISSRQNDITSQRDQIGESMSFGVLGD